MNVVLEPGKYVIAVSGGVDSVVLLDLLCCQTDLELVVAHFDHGIRPDSPDDARFVHDLAGAHSLTFVSERVKLGPGASELVARQARYDFLQRAMVASGAQAIVLAHHQDDVLETTIHNLIRGTGRRGMTSLQSVPPLLRPLLGVSKQQLLNYALQYKLSWREDTTNHDETYTRNYIRHRLLVRFDDDARQQLLTLIDRQRAVNAELDAGLEALVAEHVGQEGMNRRWFASLPHDISKEVLALWLRQHGLTDYDRKTLERLVVQLKVRPVGTILDVKHGYSLIVGADVVAYNQRLASADPPVYT